jgi:hypothetical protein
MSNKEEKINFYEKESTFLCRIVFGIILIDLIFSFFSNTLIHQLQSPVIKYPYLDPVFWLMHLLKIPELVTSNWLLAWFWDIMLFAVSVGIIIFPRKRGLIAVFIVFYFVYYIIFNSYGTHHTHFLIPFLITPVAFLFSKKSFSFTWQGMRYFLLFSYSAAFFWKLSRLSWLHTSQGMQIMKNNLMPYLLFNPNTFLANIYFWFSQHPVLVQSFYVAGFILEGLFIVGFFTKKFDYYLFIISLLLPFGFWFMADVLFYEMAVLSLTLLPFSFIDKLRAYRFKTVL